MHLFAGAGGGILADLLLGHQPVCAVEINEYCQQVLSARQKDGCLPWFPIFADVTQFDGKPWSGRVDVVSGGFPCQDISAAGKGAGIGGERSGLWAHMARIVGEVRPKFVFVENSPMLTSRGLDRVLGDLAALGYDAEWMCLSAAECGARHKRDRIWIQAYSKGVGLQRQYASGCNGESGETGIRPEPSGSCGREDVANSMRQRQQGQGKRINTSNIEADCEGKAGHAFNGGQSREWPTEPGVGGKIDGLA